MNAETILQNKIIVALCERGCFAVNHTVGDFFSGPATCTKAGVKTFTCTVCGATKTEVEPYDGLAGDINGDGKVNTKDTDAASWLGRVMDLMSATAAPDAALRKKPEE